MYEANDECKGIENVHVLVRASIAECIEGTAASNNTVVHILIIHNELFLFGCSVVVFVSDFNRFPRRKGIMN